MKIDIEDIYRRIFRMLVIFTLNYVMLKMIFAFDQNKQSMLTNTDLLLASVITACTYMLVDTFYPRVHYDAK